MFIKIENNMKKKECQYLPLFGILLFANSLAQAGDQVGTLTQIEGPVMIFSHPSKVLSKEMTKTLQTSDQAGTPVLYQGEYFLTREAKVGDLVEKGNIVRTTPASKARLIFPNGDQIHIGSGTFFRVSWDQDTAKAKTQIDLPYGKIRGIIEKGGARSRLKVKTKTAIMGVRGTDFFILGDGAQDGTTEISLLRGEVEVVPKTKPKTYTLKAGFSAEIKTHEDAKNPLVVPQVELRKTTQEEFIGIQRSSVISSGPIQSKEVAPELSKRIENLEKKAVETTLKDIKTSDPKLFAALEKQNKAALKLEDLNRSAVQQLFKDAPPAPEKRKPKKTEMENLENGAYEKYFKHLDE
jgi:hypothetical protein